MSDKTKEQLIVEWKSRHSVSNRMKDLPSVQFVEEASCRKRYSGRWVIKDASERAVRSDFSETVVSSVSEDTPQRDPTAPEKEKIVVCSYCSKRIEGSRALHEIGCFQSSEVKKEKPEKFDNPLSVEEYSGQDAGMENFDEENLEE